jgi:anti-anti-sigma factor
MLEIHLYTIDTIPSIKLKGKIDGLTGPDIGVKLDELETSGERNILIDFSGVNFINSSGLNVFITHYKKLKEIGGELYLISPGNSVNNIFRISGLMNLFKFFESAGSAVKYITAAKNTDHVESFINAGIKFEVIKHVSSQCELIITGDTLKLETGYCEKDMTSINSEDAQYGLGLAALGNGFEDVRETFGESVIINKSFFSYPAVKHSYPDYMLSSHSAELFGNAVKYNFLNGFYFSGEPSAVLKFDSTGEAIDIEALLKTCLKFADGDLFGIVLLGISGGVNGINLKKIPLKKKFCPETQKSSERTTSHDINENKTATGLQLKLSGNSSDKNIFNKWFDYTIEPEYFNNVMSAVGVIRKSGTTKNSDAAPKKSSEGLFPQSGNSHLHCAVFERGLQNILLSKNINDFSKELSRVTNNYKVHKVFHLLSGSKIKSGFAGIFKLIVNK